MLTTTLRVLAAAAVLFSSSCGGGGGAAAPTIDLTGYWKLYMTPAGGTESGPAPLFLSQTGAAVDGAAITGTVSGNTFSLTSTVVGLFTLVVDGALVGNTATGTMTISGGINATGTFRLVGFVPTGTMTATGTINGASVAMSTTAAIGVRDYTDPGLTALSVVEIAAAYGSEHLAIDFSPAGLVAGALAVPSTITATVTYRNDTVVYEQDATSGTVTVTSYDGNGLVGTFTLTLPGGDTLSGSFDVSWDIASYTP
jgi:hypothetical protein